MQDWKKDLSDFFTKLEKKKNRNAEKIKQNKSEAERFFSTVVDPAFNELKAELEKHRRKVGISVISYFASISVEFEGKDEFSYKIEISQKHDFPYAECSFIEKADGKMYRHEDILAFDRKDFSDVTKDDIIRDFLRKYKERVGGILSD